MVVYNGFSILDDRRTISSLNVKENDLLLINTVVNPPAPSLGSSVAPHQPFPTLGGHPSTTAPTSFPPSSRGGGGSGVNLHQLRNLRQIPRGMNPMNLYTQVISNPNLMKELEGMNPKLAAAAKESKEKFRGAWMEMEAERAFKDQARRDLIRRAEEDPMNTELQKQIQEEIDQENIMKNMELAMEYNPEVFTSVHMLYIETIVNGVAVKAFVDSGAQSSIMSEECAHRCGIMRLVDKRYAGMAVGVGTAKLIGRVHQTELKIGDKFFTSAFTVMENQKHNVDFLFGVDMLKRHQCCIDLHKNVLRFTLADFETPFLAEKDLPDAAKLTKESKESKESTDVEMTSTSTPSSAPTSSVGGNLIFFNYYFF